MLQQQHYNAELVRAIAENVTLAWQQLMYHAEERQKLVMASTNWYKTAEQVRTSTLLNHVIVGLKDIQYIVIVNTFHSQYITIVNTLS